MTEATREGSEFEGGTFWGARGGVAGSAGLGCLWALWGPGLSLLMAACPPSPRQHCTLELGSYIKDLSVVHSDLSSIVILDNSPGAYRSHPGRETVGRLAAPESGSEGAF